MAALVPLSRPGHGSPLHYTLLRVLGPEDCPRLVHRQVGAEVGGPPLLAKLRHAHHLLAQTLAAGHTTEMASLITGFTTVRVNQLRTDPTFAELMAHYQSVEEVRGVELSARAEALGISSLDELQERMEQAPESFSKKDLMGLAELALTAKKLTKAEPVAAVPPVFQLVFGASVEQGQEKVTIHGA